MSHTIKGSVTTTGSTQKMYVSSSGTSTSFDIVDEHCPYCGSLLFIFWYHEENIAKYRCNDCIKIFDEPVTMKKFKQLSRKRKIKRVIK